jgi:RNA ligase (TIGR02306 family)
MERKLASIQIVSDVQPIEGADRIEQAKVLGWSVVVKKGEFKPGDRCIFFEIDAVLPEGQPWAEFMRERHFRVKTAKMRGVLSQGLALTLDILPRVPAGVATFSIPVTAEQTIGWDVTELLDVKKYDPPEAGGVIGGQSAGPFPPVPKTDEIRLQSAPGLLDELRGKSFYATVKIDGTSGTFARMHQAYGPYRQGDLVVCTRTRSIRRPEHDQNAFWKLAEHYELATRLPEGYAIQGEVAGPKIQRNRLELENHELFVFNVFDMRENRYLDYQPFVDFCKDHGLRTVPLIDIFSEMPYQPGGNIWMGNTGQTILPTMERFVEFAEGLYEGTKNRREGVVIRPLIESRSEALGGARLSFKVINNSFLLKDED